MSREVLVPENKLLTNIKVKAKELKLNLYAENR